MSRDIAVLYHSILDVSGKSIWDTLCQGNHDEIDKNLEKQISFDKDLWILEVEEKGGHGLLERPYLEKRLNWRFTSYAMGGYRTFVEIKDHGERDLVIKS